MPKIVKIVGMKKKKYRITLEYDDGLICEVDFSEVIARGGVFSLLKEKSFFEQVSIGENGRSLVWPNKLDFCADALRLKGVKKK